MRALTLLLVLLVACQASPSPSAPTPTSTPSAVDSGTPAADAVVAAFRDHAVVALGELHGSARLHELFRAVVADPRLVGVLDVIVVEFGNARHQATIDRYVAGESVPSSELEAVWTDTTQRSGVWDAPVYREFYRFVRELNASRRPRDAVRVLLGDPPIDWDRITHMASCDDRQPTCLDYWIFRRSDHFARVVDGAVADGHHVLAIAGSGHVRRNPDIGHPVSMVDLLDAAHPGATWSIVPAETPGGAVLALTAGAPADVPTAFPLRGTPLGAVPEDEVFARGTVTCDPGPCETPGPAPLLEAVADALLVL